MAKLYVGLSGYSYPEWKGEGRFYPPTLKSKEFFSFYSQRFNALEGVGGYYSVPSDATVQQWVDASPSEFMVSPKMHQKVTHLSRLKPTGFERLGEFVKAVEPLRDAGKLGPFLIQLPPNLKRDDALLDAFLAEISQYSGVKWSFDFRNESWNTPEIRDVFQRHSIGWVAEDTEDHEAVRHETAEHIYVRLRKDEYSDDQLKEWTEYFLAKVAEGKDCFVYCRHTDIEAPWKWADRILELSKLDSCR